MPTANLNDMTKPKIQIGDEIREMTDAEFSQYKIDIQAAETKAASLNQREIEKIALLNRLGITAEEAALLLG